MGHWEDSRESNLLDGFAHFYDTYECSDKKYIAIGSIEPQFYSELLEKLEIEDNVAQNVLKILAKSQNSSLREAIAIHPNTSLEDLNTLEFDERSEVRDATLFRKLPKEWRKISNSEKAEKLRKYEGNLRACKIRTKL